MRSLTSLAGSAPGRWAAGASASAAAPLALVRGRVRVVLAPKLVVVPPQRRFDDGDRDDRSVADQDNPALDLRLRFGNPAAQLGLRRAVRRRDSYGIGDDRAVRGRRPGEDFADERILHGRHDESGKPLVQPPWPAEVPGLQMAVGEAPFRHLLDRPLRRGLVVRRAGQTRAVNIRQIMHGPHDLRIVAPFLADTGIDVMVDRLGRRRRNGRGDEDDQRSNYGSGHESSVGFCLTDDAKSMMIPRSIDARGIVT